MLQRVLSTGLRQYGMVLVLLLLCAYYSWATLQQRPAVGVDGGRDAVAQLLAGGRPARVAIVAGDAPEDRLFVAEATRQLQAGGVPSVTGVPGDPPAARRALKGLVDGGVAPDALVATPACHDWLPGVLERLRGASAPRVVVPRSHLWPTFLLAENLLNVANQIVVIAVVAVGMTMVIITGGIDLSVGSLIAYSAVLSAYLIHNYAGGATGATTARLVACSAVAITAAGAVGAFSGAMVTRFRVPPFIATLAILQIASGRAYKLADGQSIYDMPAAFTWLGRGVGPLGVPNAVWMMVGLFAVAHLILSRTRFGRYVYAIGGNAEAARLSGVNVNGVLMIVYTLSGLAAGLGGVLLASQLQSGSPQYGASYELYVITAVVVGGTSLSGGEGSVLGTLVGALIIAVIQNGMNLTGINPYAQKEVLGWVILGAVLLDQLKRGTWRLPMWLRPAPAVPNGAAPLDRQPSAEAVA